MAVRPNFAVIQAKNVNNDKFNKLIHTIANDIKALNRDRWKEVTDMGEHPIYIAWQLCSMLLLMEDENNLSKLIEVMSNMIEDDNADDVEESHTLQ